MKLNHNDIILLEGSEVQLVNFIDACRGRERWWVRLVGKESDGKLVIRGINVEAAISIEKAPSGFVGKLSSDQWINRLKDQNLRLRNIVWALVLGILFAVMFVAFLLARYLPHG